jgi:beta-lactamase class A
MENRSQRDWAISLEKEAANFQGRAGIFLYGLDSGIQFSYQGGRCFPAASLIKIPPVPGSGRTDGGRRME